MSVAVYPLDEGLDFFVKRPKWCAIAWHHFAFGNLVSLEFVTFVVILLGSKKDGKD